MKAKVCDCCGDVILKEGRSSKVRGYHIATGLLGELKPYGHIDICDRCWAEICNKRKYGKEENSQTTF